MGVKDTTRLLRLDERIVDLEYLYQRELMREQELNKRTLLMSRGFKYRIENLRKAREKLRKSMSRAPSQEMRSMMILAEKKHALEEAQKELEYLKNGYKNLMTQVMVTKDDYIAQQALDMASEVRKQQSRVSGYELSVTRYLERSSTKETPRARHNPERDAKQILNSTKEISQRDPRELLGQDPNWNRTAASVSMDSISGLLNAPTFEPVEEPRKRVVIDFDE
jgi:hypothetical protein